MKAWIVGLFAFVWQWWATWRPPVEPDADTVVIPTVDVTLPQASPRDPEQSVRWHFKGDILDRLDEYFICLRRLRGYDAPAYDLFSRVGMLIPADRYCNPDSGAYERFFSIGFGGCLMGSTEPHELITPSFFYFQQVARSHVVRDKAQGRIYRLGVLFDDRDASKRWASRLTHGCSCYLDVQSDGTIRVLRENIQQRSYKRIGRQKHTRQHLAFLSQHAAVPEWLRDVATEHDTTPDAWAERLLRMAVLTYTQGTERIVVRASRAGLTAAFGIDVARCKYFFKDRETEALAADGKRKRIFHAVTEHTRKLATGKRTLVRDHYRGLRHFTWNSTAIHIVLPANSTALHGSLAAVEFEDAPMMATDWLDAAQTGHQIGAMLDR